MRASDFGPYGVHRWSIGWVVLFVMALVLVAGCNGVAPSSPAPTTPAVVTAPPLTDARGDEFERALASGDPAIVQEAVAMPSGQTISPEAVAQLKALPPLSIVPGSFKPIDAVTGVVDATSADGTWRVYLVYEDSVWRMAMTEKTS